MNPMNKWYHKENIIDGLILTALLISPFIGNALLGFFEKSEKVLMVDSSNVIIAFNFKDFVLLFLAGPVLWFSMTTYAAYQLRSEGKLASRQNLLKWLAIISSYCTIIAAVYRMEMSSLRQGILGLLLFIIPLSLLVYWIFKK
jgi:hypothetical protein